MKSVERLINNFVPEHYDADISINASDNKLKGTAVIKGTAVEGGNSIKLHSKDLTIESVLVDDQPATATAGEDDLLEITTGEQLSGEHTVTISYTGEADEHMHGFYPSDYKENGKKKKVLSTQFQSIYAREVLPSVDEPEAKATFSFTLTTEVGDEPQVIRGNMPIAHQETVDGHTVTKFEKTPPMSTYLIAFAVGALQKVTRMTKSGVEVNAFATHNQARESLEFAADTQVKSIEALEEYFGVPYPLPKYDIVAVPNFEYGAMENWGLNIYREASMLAHPEQTSVAARRNVIKTIIHETTHQWFGNLVTMKWWDELWLNESFASVMEYIMSERMYPEWNTWNDFSTSEVVGALDRDSIDGVQSVQVEVHHPDEIDTLFDPDIVYAKGARLMSMLHRYIGDDAYRAGLKKYFLSNAHGNTKGGDLWRPLEEASGKPVADLMNAWIFQSGYPVVRVTRDGDNVTLKQEQFFVGPHEPSDKLWPIPLDAVGDGAPELMDGREVSWATDGPIRLNQHDSTHFITHYDDLSRQSLIDQVADGTLDTIGRIQLLHESTLLARGGVLSTEKLIPLVEAYRNETLDTVWDMIDLAMSELIQFVENDEAAEAKLKQLNIWMAKEQYDRLGWEPKDGESEGDAQLRGTIIGMMLYGEDPDALAKAKKLYETVPLEDLNPELRSLIIGSVVRHGDGQVVDDLMAKYVETSSPDIQRSISMGVVSTRTPEKIAQLLDNMKNREIIRTQDLPRWFYRLSNARYSREQAWRWTRDNWDWVEETFGGDPSYSDFAQDSASALVTREQLEEYKEFFGPKKDIVALTRTIEMGIREIEGRVELIERDSEAVKNALLEGDWS